MFFFVLYHLSLSENFKDPKFSMGLFFLGGGGGGYFLVQELFLGFVGSPRDFWGVLFFAPIQSSLSLEIIDYRSAPPSRLVSTGALWLGSWVEKYQNAIFLIQEAYSFILLLCKEKWQRRSV